jgi:replicative DNA helicase
MIDLRPGTVTTIASLPTAGRSTFTLNMALHNALQGTCTLYTSSELDEEALTSKVISALYGIDLRHKEAPLGGWDTFSARTKEQVKSIPLHLHQSMGTPEQAFKDGTVSLLRHGHKLGLWFVDALYHFADFTTDDGSTDFDQRFERAMEELRAIAERQQIAVVVTARAENDGNDETLTLKHVDVAVAEMSDQVLMLHRDGVYWSGEVSDVATVTRLKPELEGSATLRLLPRLCRFAHFGINI